jgi:hypothetical protein
LVEVLLSKIPNLEEILRTGHDGTTVLSSVTDVPFIPLGQQRLRSVDLIFNIIKMKKESLNNALGESKIFCNLMQLVKEYPWNNFLQLKVINICTEIIENNDNAVFRRQFLNASGIAKEFIEMSQQAFINMESQRSVRNGYMALIVSISNKLQKCYEGNDKSEDNTVIDYLDRVGEDWRAYVDDELKKSNENNNKTLGGCSTKNNNSDENEEENSNYDV